MAYRLVTIDALRIGMHVAKLDVAWFRSPFLRHSFLIRTHEQIEKLRRAGVKQLTIDPARGLDLPEISNLSGAKPKMMVQAGSSATATPPTVRSLAKMTEELEAARSARRQLEQSVQSTFSRIVETGVADPEKIRHIIHEIDAVAKSLTTHALFMAFSQGRDGDNSLSEHALATCSFSMILAHAASYDLIALQDMATGALLHDIGLLQVPPYLLKHIYDTSTTQSEANRRIYESHARAGAILLERHGGFSPAVEQIVAEHHAYMNASGFPADTNGAFTSDMTRLIMVTDRYDELLTGFGGGSPLTPHQSLQRLYQEGHEGKYENRLVSLFVKVMGIYPVYSYVALTTGERAVVSVISPRRPHQPIVTITHDPSDTPYIVPLVIDLANQDERAPMRAICSIIETVPSEIDQTIR